MNGYSFTTRVRHVLANAREEANRLHHEYVGTEHILLALARADEDSVAAAVLRNLAIDPAMVRKNVHDVVKIGSAPHPRPELPYTSRAKRILELAMAESRELGHNYVGTEHLLLGLIREEKGIAAQVLAELGVTLEAARVDVLRNPDVVARAGALAPQAVEGENISAREGIMTRPNWPRLAKVFVFWLIILLIPIVLIQLTGK